MPGTVDCVSKEGCSTLCGFPPVCNDPGHHKDFWALKVEEYTYYQDFRTGQSGSDPQNQILDRESYRRTRFDRAGGCAAVCEEWTDVQTCTGSLFCGEAQSFDRSGCENQTQESPPFEINTDCTGFEDPCAGTNNCTPATRSQTFAYTLELIDEDGSDAYAESYNLVLSEKVIPNLNGLPDCTEAPPPIECVINGTECCTFLTYYGDPIDPFDPCSKNKGPNFCMRSVEFTVNVTGLDPTCTYDIVVTVTRAVPCNSTSSAQPYTVATVTGETGYTSGTQVLPVEEGAVWCVQGVIAVVKTT